MALITQSNSGATFSSLLAPFTSVATATVRPLKGISAAELATLREGDMVYTTSIRDYWKWVPTSTATDDSSGAAANLRYCNPTVNGANPGRFERLFIYSPDWLLQNFTIDSAAGNNEADGAVTPLATDSELSQRWGINPRIRIPITVTYAQSPAGPSNYNAFIEDGGSLTLLGTRTVTQTAVTITAVTALNRATPVGWAITGATFGAADVGRIAIITAGTAANIGAYAYIVAQAGTTLTISPFGKFAPTIVGTGFTQVTPAVNDVVQIVTLTTIQVGSFIFRSHLYNEALNTPTRNCVVFDSLLLSGNTNVGNSKIQIGEIATFYARCITSDLDFEGYSGSFAVHSLCGGGATNSFVPRAAAIVRAIQTGFRNAFVFVQNGGVFDILTDTYFQNSLVSAFQGSATVQSTGGAFFNRTSSNSCINVQPGGVWKQTGGVPDWGTGNTGHGIRVFSQSAYIYATKPTVNTGLGAGREALIGGTDKLLAAVPYIEGANNAALTLLA